MNKSIRTLSLFSGGGGLDIGFEKAGFEILFATDFNHECCETLRLNSGTTLNKNLIVEEHDITTMDFDILPRDIDMIIGGPPCQSFSASGRRAGGAAGKLDKRGNLFKSYCEVVALLEPKAFLFENVRGILGTNKGKDFQDIVSSFELLGYHVEHRILDAEDYGVPQQRERMFIVGHKLENHFLYPRPVFGPDSLQKVPYISVGEAIKDVRFTEQDKKDTAFEGGKYSELLPLVPPGSNYLHFTAKRGYPEPIFAYRSRFSDFLYKANPKCPVKTLIASPGKYTGPLHWKNRYLTVNEYKRIQGFPDDHIFYGDRTAQIRQIGNSVCPKVAYYMALAIREQIFGIESNIDYLQPEETLSFDKRKGQKAKLTKAIHRAVVEQNKIKADYSFTLKEFETYVTPSSSKNRSNMKVTVSDLDTSLITVHCDASGKIEAILNIVVYDGVNKDRKILLKVVVYGNDEQDIQTMWNAVDLWVRHCSNFRSLIELYGHFTEPHPIFEVKCFDVRTNLPSFKFAAHCMNFNNCSEYFPKEHLLEMWKTAFGKDNFVDLARTLRSYRFDVRCHETNIAIPQGVYMVAYPFALPYDKQMNFYVREEKY
jgi:DNA (cytosine-5)-methyltransferase 1